MSNKIKVIMSCDENPVYYEFWNEVSYVWNTLFNIEPVLIYISNNDNNRLSEENGKIIRIELQKDIPNYLQGQLARIYYSSLFPDDVCILSDIDIIPLNKLHFNKQNIIHNTKAETFFHLNPTKREFGQYPMCYYAGFGKTYSKLFDNLTWKEFLLSVISYNFSVDRLGYSLPPHLSGNKFWFSDELYLFNRTKEKNITVNTSHPIILEQQRISREQLLKIDVKNIKNYIDCHMPRPYNLYEKQINYLIFGIENE